jgi:polyprenyl P-hydroxybenzoate/phenylacrylic acid decarboxylase-like protein
MPRKIIVGITGSSGVVMGIRALEEMKKAGIETHLILTDVARKVIEDETDHKARDVEKMATRSYANDDFFSPPASGSFRTDGMIVIPCSMKTLAGIASGYSDSLLLRAADVMLKERRKLVLVARETPLSLVHIRNMERVTLAGGIVAPPMLAFYSKPRTVEGMVEHAVGKALDLLGIDTKYNRWK